MLLPREFHIHIWYCSGKARDADGGWAADGHEISVDITETMSLDL